ncbi:MarR family transcriptional regulator [Microbacterium caowuchunii]|uniref:MarR family transcriptional regulator n=2 Tax=Microbacterium caowuchunii TaxID=2614638 RepID=A0A5N0TNE8_9MICO|nr:MarR family transcriptional regulator [Microbacterium caowuchunii]
MVDDVVTELARHGHPGVTATHEFALRAIASGAQSASELGRRLGVSKQAAAKTIATLEELGYVERQDDPEDGRRRAVIVTPRGNEMMSIGARAFDRFRARLAARVGAERLEVTEAVLATLIAERASESPEPANGHR